MGNNRAPPGFRRGGMSVFQVHYRADKERQVLLAVDEHIHKGAVQVHFPVILN